MNASLQMVAQVPTSEPDPVRELAANALPSRPLKIPHKALTDAIIERIAIFKASPWEPHREKNKDATKIARRLHRAIKRASDALLTLGVENDIRAAQLARRFTVQIGMGTATPVKLRGHSAPLDLYLIAGHTLERVRSWNRLYRRNGAPRTPGVALTERICELLRDAGCTETERADLLDQLSEQHGLPKLSFETLKKNARRRNKRRAGDKASKT